MPKTPMGKTSPPETDAVFTRTQVRHLCQGRTKHLSFYQCKKCSTESRAIEQARDHAVTHDESLRADLEKYRASKRHPRISCERCGKEYADTPSGRCCLASHLNNCGDTDTTCNICGKDFKKPAWLKSHMTQNPWCMERSRMCVS